MVQGGPFVSGLKHEEGEELLRPVSAPLGRLRAASGRLAGQLGGHGEEARLSAPDEAVLGWESAVTATASSRTCAASAS